MPITKKTTLRSWKNFVLEFRRNFEIKYREADRVDSLSLLVLAVAVFQLSESSSCSDDDSTLKDGSSTLNDGAPTPLDTCDQVFDATQKSLALSSPSSKSSNSIRFELKNCARKYYDEFATILSHIEKLNLCENPFALGYTYQYWCESDRKIAQVEIQSADKVIDKNKLVAFTQIYTPPWVVEFILANTLLAHFPTQITRQSIFADWLLQPASHHSSNTTEHAESETENTNTKLSNLTILDPAVGAGNFLISAFDLLFDLYRTQNVSPTDAVKNIFEKQLHGCDVDSTALSVCALALVCKALRARVHDVPPLAGLALSEPHDEKILGSLSTNFSASHPLTKKFDVVITNPPYIGRKLMSRQLKALMKSRFPKNHHDLSAAFFQRSLDLLNEGGRLGLITQASMMFLPSHTQLRELIVDRYKLLAAVDAGPGVFPLQGGEKVNSAILIVENPREKLPSEKVTSDKLRSAERNDERNTAFFSTLKDESNKSSALRAQIKNAQTPRPSPTRIAPDTFRQYYGYAFNYHIPPAVAQLLTQAKKLESIADIRQGLATTDNDRFVKFAWEVSPKEMGRTWFPYVKGAGAQRFYSPVRHVVNWENDGEQIKNEVARRYPYLKGNTKWVVKNESFYFKEGLCFSFVNTKGVAVRMMPRDCIFDVGASAIFAEEQDKLLAYLNSSFLVSLASSLNPTINYQVGDLRRLPVLNFETCGNQLDSLSRSCVESAKELAKLLDPTSWFDPTVCFDPSSWFAETPSHREDLEQIQNQFIQRVRAFEQRLQQDEQQIDELVFRTVCTQQQWNKNTEAQVQKWIDSFNLKKQSRDKNISDDQLQRTFIENLVLISLLHQSGYSESPENILSPELIDAIERRINTNLQSYYQSNLLPRLNKIFFGRIPDAFANFGLINVIDRERGTLYARQ